MLEITHFPASHMLALPNISFSCIIQRKRGENPKKTDFTFDSLITFVPFQKWWGQEPVSQKEKH